MKGAREPATIAPKGLPHGARHNTSYRAHKVETGDTLASVAEGIGIAWEELARFNWGTDDPYEINWYLHAVVGCRSVTEDKWNYEFSSGDNPGQVYLPAANGNPATYPVARKPSAVGGTLGTLTTGALKLEVDQLSFENGYEVWSWKNKVAFSGPAWKRAGGLSHPVCYRRGSNSESSKPLKLKARVRVRSGSTNRRISLRAIGLTASPLGNPEDIAEMSSRLVFQKDNVTVTAPEFEVPDILLVEGSRLSDKVMISDVTLRWSYSFDNETWHGMPATGPHRIYQVLAGPRTGFRLYDYGLEKACGYVNGRPGVEEAINEAIPEDRDREIAAGKRTPQYDPNEYIDVSPPLLLYGQPSCNCRNFAELMAYLYETIGGAPLIYAAWGGSSRSNFTGYWMRSAEGYWIIDNEKVKLVNCQIRASKNGEAEENPHLGYHAITMCDGTYFDPTYGTVGFPDFIEVAPGCSPQRGSLDWYDTKGNLERVTVDFVCDH